MKYTVILAAFIASITYLACNQSSTPNNEKAKTEKSTPKIKNDSSNFWVMAQTKLKINESKVKRLQAVERRYRSEKRRLKKEKNWLGPTNRPLRAKLDQERKLAVNKVIGPELTTEFEKLRTTHLK